MKENHFGIIPLFWLFVHHASRMIGAVLIEASELTEYVDMVIQVHNIMNSIRINATKKIYRLKKGAL